MWRKLSVWLIYTHLPPTYARHWALLFIFTRQTVVQHKEIAYLLTQSRGQLYTLYNPIYLHKVDGNQSLKPHHVHKADDIQTLVRYLLTQSIRQSVVKEPQHLHKADTSNAIEDRYDHKDRSRKGVVGSWVDDIHGTSREHITRAFHNPQAGKQGT